MISICVYFERRSQCGRDHPFERWNHLIRSFGVDHVYIIDRVHLPCFVPDFASYDIVEDFSEINHTGEYVFVEKDPPTNRTTVPYTEFVHPQDDAMYCFGGDACGLLYAHRKMETDLKGSWVEIPMNDNHGLWAEQAAAIILCDRWSHAVSR